MKQHVRRLTWILGAFTLVGFGALGAVACNTDNGATPLPSSTNKSDTGTGGGGDTDGDTTDTDGDTPTEEAGCTKELPKLRSNPGPYCFNGTPDEDGGLQDAAVDPDSGPGTCQGAVPVCCNGGLRTDDAGFGASTCAESVAACETFLGTNGSNENTIFECTEADQCGGSDHCCLLAGKKGTPNVNFDRDYPGCNVKYVTSNPNYQGGTRCQAKCQTGEVELCAKDADCSDGKKCIPGKVANRYTGVCEVQ